jgi:hypothetical protein
MRVLLRGGDSETGAAGEEDNDRGGLPLEEEWTEESGDELDLGERSSGLVEGV